MMNDYEVNKQKVEQGTGRKIHFRRTHKKSHLGCQNCKSRRIKCGEQLPICSQCIRAKAHCSYLDLSEAEIAERQRKKAEDSNSHNLQQPPRQPVLPSPALTFSPESHTSPPHAASPKGSGINNSFMSMSLPPISGLTGESLESPHSLPPVSALGMERPLSGGIPMFSAGPKAQLVRQGFETDMMRSVYQQWMNGVLTMASYDSNLFHALMSFSYGFLAIKTGRISYRIDSDKHRFIAVRQLQRELTKSKIENSDALLATALILSWDVFFQDGDMQSYITLSKGLAAVLEKIQVTVSATSTALCTSDALFQGIKSIHVPPYCPKFVDELVGKIKGIEKFIASSGDDTLVAEHNNLYRYMLEVSTFLQTNQRTKSRSQNMYFSPDFLFRLLCNWLKSFPLNAQSLNTIDNEYRLVLYVYYHATTRALDALFPEVRYLFQFGFIGPIDSVGIENLVGLSSGYSTDNYLLQYPLKVLTFFKERLFLINRLLATKFPLEGPGDDIITEIQIQSFETPLQSEHYPSMPSKLTPMSAPSRSDSYASRSSYSNSGESVNYESPVTSNTSSSTGASPMMDPVKSMGLFKSYFFDRMEILQSVSG